MRTPYATTAGQAVAPDGTTRAITRALPEETPVALVFDGASHAVMMATPDDIADLALGFALSEGLIDGADEIREFEAVEHDAGIEARFWLRGDRSVQLAARRRGMAGPVGCGLCGIESLEAAGRALPRVAAHWQIDAAAIPAAVAALSGAQPLHDRTRAVHAAAYLVPGEGLVAVREDVGRHNALDKLIGAMTRAGRDLSQGAFVMTSRLSVELVQKAATVGCPMLIAVSAPTAQALRLAEGAGLTLAAFARDGGFDLYSHPERVRTEQDRCSATR